jgi:hypothetical protein
VGVRGSLARVRRSRRATPPRPHLVYADHCDKGWSDYHWWVSIPSPDATTEIDFTARQFYNLVFPHAPQHADLPCPLIWNADTTDGQTYPVTGRYAHIIEYGLAEYDREHLSRQQKQQRGKAA